MADLMDVSDPTSPNYGKHWTSEDVIKRFQPSNETVETVWKWLKDSGIREESIVHSINKAWFVFHATAGQVESLLHTEHYEYQHLHSGGIMPACERYHVPKDIQYGGLEVMLDIETAYPIGECTTLSHKYDTLCYILPAAHSKKVSIRTQSARDDSLRPSPGVSKL